MYSILLLFLLLLLLLLYCYYYIVIIIIFVVVVVVVVVIIIIIIIVIIIIKLIHVIIVLNYWEIWRNQATTSDPRTLFSIPAVPKLKLSVAVLFVLRYTSSHPEVFCKKGVRCS